MSALPGVDERPEVPDGKDTLDYVSKSRIKTFLQCPRKFMWKYWAETRPPGSIHTERGSQIHETFELFHENLLDHLDEHGDFPERFTPLLPDWESWAQWVEYIGEFFRFELRRKNAAHREVAKVDAMMAGLKQQNGLSDFDGEWRHLWEPVGVETEFWVGGVPDSWERGDPSSRYVSSGDPPIGDIPWMGFADLIVNTPSVPGVEGNGVVIIDYKTGTAPTIKYEGKPWLEDNLNEGIFLEGEYYGWLAEEIDSFDYEVDAVAGYYPRNDEFIVSTYPDQNRRRDIKRAVLGMQRTPDIENFGTSQSGLCHWNNRNGEGQCFFHDVCEVRHNCKHCGTKGTDSATSGKGRYDS